MYIILNQIAYNFKKKFFTDCASAVNSNEVNFFI